ncbi:hypothetical protein [uncultured Ramlibacter sp.]|uniref:hypothetical protein n=1 Tax=uncultured Ramlibacter sp. TaxID=260755 RepID=UPI0026061092|nr:hypothetical protein [uncultured Ramlibacter sp.]
MKKFTPIALAALLACGAPLVTQAAGADENRDGNVSVGEAARDTGRQAKGIAADAGHTFTKGVRSITHPEESGKAAVRAGDTRSMGAAPASQTDGSDAGRRSRMDEAYASWKRKNG